MRALVLLAAGLLACKQAQPEARRLVAPSATEAEAFAKDFAMHVGPCNPAELDRRIDAKLLFTRAFAGRKVPDAEKDGFVRGFGSVGRSLCRELTEEARVDVAFLRLRTVDGAPRPLLRLVTQGILTYVELELDKQAGGVRVADLTMASAGERFSDVIGGAVDMLDAPPAEVEALAEKTQRVNSLMANKQWKDAEQAFRALPSKFRATKAARLMELRIAAELGDDTYRVALEAFAKASPNDAALALLQIDRALLQKQPADALRHIDGLDQHVGGDPYLDVLRADAQAAAGKLDEALAAAERAAKAVPAIDAVWWVLLTQQAANARFADATATLAVLRDRFQHDVSAETLGSDERFTVLVQSPEFAAWAQ